MADEGDVSFEEALSFLFDKCTRKGGKPFSDREVSRELKALKVDASYSYIWMLRSGKKTDPRASVITGLARFFGVPSGFFLDRAVHDEWVKRINRGTESAEVPAQRGRRGQAALLRGSFPGMSDQARTLIEALAAHVSELESEGPGRS
jgi:hypothetical protein